MLRFEFPSLSMGAGVGTRPSFTPKGLPYSHHFRLSLCGHQVRPVWADTCAHMGAHSGGWGQAQKYKHRHVSGHSGEWAHVGRRPWKHAHRHGNTPGKAHKGTHRRAQEHSRMYENTLGLMGGWSQVRKCKHEHTWGCMSSHSTNIDTHLGMWMGQRHAGGQTWTHVHMCL